MNAFYNDNDPYVCAWLRELIAQGHLPQGTVNGTSIRELEPKDICGATQVHLFAGIGGWAYALKLAGWPEDEPVWTGSCPCQPFSVAGKGRGVDDERHLWPEFRRLIEQCKPPTIFGEQVASAAGRVWLTGVRADLEAMGYAVGAADLCAAGVGAPHIRQRLFWVAHSQRLGPQMRERSASGSLPSERCNELAGGLANAEYAERRPKLLDRQAFINRHDAGRAETYGEPGACSEVCGLDNASSPRRNDARERADLREERCGKCLLGAAGDVGGLDNATPMRWADGTPLQREHDGTVAVDGCQSNAWGRFDTHACLDGKTRRIPVESAFFPLVDGVCPARVVKLRGAGNAIVPQLAAEFIIAFQEALTNFP